MRRALSTGLVIVASLLMAAHLLRSDLLLLTVGSALLPFLLMVRRSWVPVLIQLVLLAAAGEWVRTTITLARDRIAAGEPWSRMVMILGAVTAVTLWAAWTLRHPDVRRRFPPS